MSRRKRRAARAPIASGPCPTPDKTRFPSASAAAGESIRIRVDHRGAELSAYECVCGWWHLTRPKALEHRIRIALSDEGTTKKRRRR